jgi:AcrR family transcriptional regulator
VLALVNTVLYGAACMSDQLSAQNWIDAGLKALAKSGFSALKAEPLAKSLGVSRGSFYWHFADIGAFHAAILKAWREVAAEAIIANVEAVSERENALAVLLRRVFSEKLVLERAVRSWAAFDAAAKSAVQAIDRRRLDYVETLIRARGVAPDKAQARAQILYWAFLGYALSDRPPGKTQSEAVIAELVAIASL